MGISGVLVHNSNKVLIIVSKRLNSWPDLRNVLAERQDVTARGQVGNGLSPPKTRIAPSSVSDGKSRGWGGRCPETQQGLPAPSLAQRLSHFLTQRTRCFTHLTQRHEDASGIHKQLPSSWPDPVRDHSPRSCFSALPGPCRAPAGARDTRWHWSARFPPPKNSVTFMRERIIITRASHVLSAHREQPSILS